MEIIEQSDAGFLAPMIAAAIREGRLDDADRLLEELHILHPASKENLTFQVMIAIQRGRVLDALQHINGLPDDQCPELKTLCLKILGNPIWEGHAEALLDHHDPFVRKAMRELLGRSSEETSFI
jgi:type III secretion protein HrpB1